MDTCHIVVCFSHRNYGSMDTDTTMIFDSLYESSQRRELMLVDGGMCHWHLRRDGQLTIREIISTKRGAGSLMLDRLKSHAGATSLFAKCPADLDANGWYIRRGFVLESVEYTKSGKQLNCYRLKLDHTPTDDFTFVICRGNDNVITPAVVMRTNAVYGVRDDCIAYMRPVYMVDYNWKTELTPERWQRYIQTLRDLRPYMAMVPDYEHPGQYRQLMNQISEVRELAHEVMVCPKFAHAVCHIPRECRIAVSVPTSYGGYLPQPAELIGRRLHLLGGHIDQWLYLRGYYSDAKIISGDTGTPVYYARNYGEFWSNRVRKNVKGDGLDVVDLAVATVRNMLSAWQAGEIIWSDRVANMIQEHCLPLVANRLIA